MIIRTRLGPLPADRSSEQMSEFLATVDELLAEVQAEVVGDDSFRVARGRHLVRPQGQAPTVEVPVSNRYQVFADIHQQHDDMNGDDLDEVDGEIMQAINEDMTVELNLAKTQAQAGKGNSTKCQATPPQEVSRDKSARMGSETNFAVPASRGGGQGEGVPRPTSATPNRTPSSSRPSTPPVLTSNTPLPSPTTNRTVRLSLFQPQHRQD